MAMATTLHLLIPGLLGPGHSGCAASGFPPPVAPALEWLLARAVACPVPATTDETLLQLFGLSAPTAADLPVAALTRLADGGEREAEGWWLRADPVHLRPDLREILLVDSRVLATTTAEAEALATAFNRTFAADGLQLDVPRPDRWYVRLPADPGLRTEPLIQVIGRDIGPRLPHGPAGRRWCALLTEIQMLFHHHPVNQAREERQQPLINSVWFWGGGGCPARAGAPAAGLYASDPLTRGLARLADAAISPLPERAEDWLDAAQDEADSLVVLETTRFDPVDDDPSAWIEHVARLERDWFAFCRRGLRTGALEALHLYPGNGRVYTLTGAARWRFWRRPQPLSAYGIAGSEE